MMGQTPRPPLVTRQLLLLVLASVGILLAVQSDRVVGRFGFEAFVVMVALVGVALASLARPGRQK